MSDAIAAASQALDTDPIIELWELDTTPLTNIFGQGGTGTIYRWTPGMLNYRLQGELLQVGTFTEAILEREIALPNPALQYTIQIEQLPPYVGTSLDRPGVFCDPQPLTGLTTTTGLGGGTVSAIFTDGRFPQAAQPGMAWLIESAGTVFFGGVQYQPVPIEVTEMEWSGQGKLPRPRLKISNIGGLAGALIIQFGDIVGAQVTRKRTFKSFLDGEATPDPSAFFEPDVFTVDRKSAHNKDHVEFELAALLDQQGIKLPRRIVTRDHCSRTYRQYNAALGVFVQGTCPYIGDSYFDTAGTPHPGAPGLDVCGKHLSDCLLRFGDNTPLPFYGFPGVAEAVG